MRKRRSLRAGDVVEIRSAAEILETLDADGALDSMPFMPEMLQFVGRRFTVSKCVVKICDTVTKSGGSRRMRDTVLLEDLRCDGSAHGGCQARCRLYWKGSWLRRVDADAKAPVATAGAVGESQADAMASLNDLLRRRTTWLPKLEPGEPTVFRCQATEALAATDPLRKYDLVQYLRELTSGNVGLGRFVRIGVRAVVGKSRRSLHRSSRPGHARSDGTAVSEHVGIAPGVWVTVQSRDSIERTLDARRAYRGLVFDEEMASYCGGTYRVQERVQRIIDETTGQMIEISSDCLILEGVVCRGDHSAGRWFCPRAIHPFWREAWLEQVEGP